MTEPVCPLSCRHHEVGEKENGQGGGQRKQEHQQPALGGGEAEGDSDAEIHDCTLRTEEEGEKHAEEEGSAVSAPMDDGAAVVAGVVVVVMVGKGAIEEKEGDEHQEVGKDAFEGFEAFPVAELEEPLCADAEMDEHHEHQSEEAVGGGFPQSEDESFQESSLASFVVVEVGQRRKADCQLTGIQGYQQSYDKHREEGGLAVVDIGEEFFH